MADIPKDTTPRDQAWAEKLLARYATNKTSKKVDCLWIGNIEEVIKRDLFSRYVSANTEAKQTVIILLTKAGHKVKVENIACSVVSITIDKAGE